MDEAPPPARAPEPASDPMAPSGSGSAAAVTAPVAGAATPAATSEPTSGAGPGGKKPVDAGRLRFQAKIGGVMLMLFGALFTFQFAYGAYVASQPETWEQQRGGQIILVLPSPANVTFQYANGTAQTAAAPPGNSTHQLAWAAVHVVVMTPERTYERAAIVPAGTTLPISLVGEAPNSASVGLDPSSYHILWGVALVPALAVVGGFFAFRLRAPRIALGGAFLFLLGTAALFAAGGTDLLGFSLLGTAGLCFAFIYRARGQFQPWRIRDPDFRAHS